MAYPVRAQDGAKPGADGAKAEKPAAELRFVNALFPQRVAAAWQPSVTAAFVDAVDETLGATLQPVGDTLRAQLDLPTGQGLLIASLREDSPAARAGLKQNDVLLMLADKPLSAVEDLTKRLKAAGESPQPLKVLRAGRPQTIQVRPVYRVTLGPVTEPQTEYYLGVSIDPADDALRAQLNLPAGRGVVVTDVVAGSPAEKAGVRKHDVVLELAGKPIDTPETLRAQVQAGRDRATELKLLRAGKPVTLPITAAVRQVEASSSEVAIRYWLLGQQDVPAFVYPHRVSQNLGVYSRVDPEAQATTASVLQRLDHLEKELKAVRGTLEQVAEALKKGVRNR
jgi:C-terminal processing protease CtpA/Prc